jgi:hypothetical protein
MKRVQLAHGNIAPGSSLLVELIKNSGPDAHPHCARDLAPRQ